MASEDKTKLEENGYTVYGLPEQSRCFQADAGQSFFNWSMSTEDFIKDRLDGRPFSNLTA